MFDKKMIIIILGVIYLYVYLRWRLAASHLGLRCLYLFRFRMQSSTSAYFECETSYAPACWCNFTQIGSELHISQNHIFRVNKLLNEMTSSVGYGSQSISEPDIPYVRVVES